MLSGCVAALPLAAGGALLARGEGDLKEKVVPKSEITLMMPETISTLGSFPGVAKGAGAANDKVLKGELPPVADGKEQAKVILLDMTELPAPVPSRRTKKASPAIEADEDIPANTRDKPALTQTKVFVPASSPGSRIFYTYAHKQALRDPVTKGRQSALLANPSLLKDDRTDCSIRPPAVLLDLDPQSAAFDTKIDPQTNPDLSHLLALLRRQGVEVFWISGNTAFEAPAIRRHLRTSGLDEEGRDPLLLMRRDSDSKQTRRRELGETHCVVAIAGDTRGDFDELFLYLKDPATAASVEKIIGAGWFLISLPLQEGG